MKPIIIITILALFICAEDECRRCQAEEATTTETKAMLRRLAEAEDLLKSGKTNEYRQMIPQLTKEIVAGAPRDMCPAATLLLEQHLSRDLKPDECHLDSLDSAEQLASFIMSAPDSTASERGKRAELVARFLGRVRDCIISNFRSLPVVANVSPPAGVVGFAGMDPNAIADPGARQKYCELIEKNQQNNNTNKWQLLLNRYNDGNSQRIVDYLAEAYKQGGGMSNVVESWENAARLSDEERKQLRNKTAK